LATVVIQGLCLYHASQTGRTQQWFYILLLLPGIGSLNYFLFESLPDLASTRYALLHQKLGHVAKAAELLESVVKACKQQPRHAQALNRDWYNVARRNLEG
jgi:hypothetical protein